MIIKKASLVSFGRFQGEEVGFDNGINLVYGPNEAGKSTLQNFITGMLYGFLDYKISGKRKYSYLQEKYRPWSNQRYFGILEYQIEHNIYRIERNFDNNQQDVRIFEDGIDVTNTFEQNRQKERLFAEQHTGLSPRAFLNTISIGQLSSKTEDMLIDEVKTKLINIKNSGDQDLSVQRAKGALQKQIDFIGTTRSTKKELGQVVLQIEEIEQKIKKSINESQLLEDIKNKIVTNTTKLNTLKAYLAREKLRKLNQYTLERDHLSKELEGFTVNPDIDSEKEEIIFNYKNQIDLDISQINKLEIEKHNLCKHSEELELTLETYRQYRHIRDEDIALYGIYNENLKVLKEEIKQVQHQLTSFDEETDKCVIEKDITREKQKLTRLVKSKDTVRKRIISSLTLSLILGGLSLLFPILWILTSGLVIILIVLLIKRNSIKGSIIDIQISIGDIERKLIGIDNKNQFLEDKKSLHKNNLQSLYAKQENISRLLESITDKFPKNILELDHNLLSSTLKKNLSIYREMVNKIESTIGKIEDVEDEITRLKSNIDKRYSLIEKIIGKKEVTIQQYLDYCKNLKKYKQYQQLEQFISEVIQGQSLQQLEREAALEVNEEDVLNPMEYLVEIRQLSKTLIELEHQARIIENNPFDITSLVQEMDVLRQRRKKIEMQKKALELSLDKITQISNKIQKTFTPQLNNIISQAVGIITDRRYRNISLDEDLNIMVEVPETKEYKSIQNLSSGTIDQFYLALRIALGKIMASDKNLPIILDDSFTQYDDIRTERVLRYLETIAKDNQVIIFTCHIREKQIMDKLKISHQYISLKEIG